MMLKKDDNEKNLKIDLDDDYILNEGTQILIRLRNIQSKHLSL